MNKVTDLLAKEGLKMLSNHFLKEWIFPPVFFQNQIRIDKAGTILKANLCRLIEVPVMIVLAKTASGYMSFDRFF